MIINILSLRMIIMCVKQNNTLHTERVSNETNDSYEVTRNTILYCIVHGGLKFPSNYYN